MIVRPNPVRRRTRLSLAFLMVATMTANGPSVAAAQERPVFHAEKGSSISSAVVVPARCDMVYLSGLAAWTPGDPVPQGLDTEAQTARTIEAVKAELSKYRLTLNDVVMMRTYLVADPGTGRMDFAGYNRAYRRYFLDQPVPARPARATVQVAGLALDGMLVEIEVVAAKRCGGK